MDAEFHQRYCPLYLKITMAIKSTKGCNIFNLPGPSSTDKGLPVRSTGSPIVTPAKQ